MKFSEKMLLIKQGATMADIKKLEEEEAAEIAASKAKDPEPTPEPTEPEPVDDSEKKELLTALEAAQKAAEASNNLLKAKEDELAALNEKYAKLANQQTIVEPPAYTEKEVFEELFTPNKKEEK